MVSLMPPHPNFWDELSPRHHVCRCDGQNLHPDFSIFSYSFVKSFTLSQILL